MATAKTPRTRVTKATQASLATEPTTDVTEATVTVTATEVVEPTAEPEATEVQAPEAAATEATAIVAPEEAAPGELATNPMPPMEERAVNDLAPVVSYKTPRSMQDTPTWKRSFDGGVTSESANTLAIGGQIVDLRLNASEAKWKEGWTDYRLSLIFLQEGEIAEVNLNAINPSREDQEVLVMSGAVRSLLGGLLVASESEEDMQALRHGMRLTLKAGNRGSAFIDLAAAYAAPDGTPRWVNIGDYRATQRVPQGVSGVVATVEQIRRRMVPAGVLLPGPGLYGEFNDGEANAAVDVSAQAV